MPETYFDTFVRAVRDCKDREGILGDEVLIFPPRKNYGYWATPRNALTFGAMGVDGVHYAILRIDGHLTDQSPVIHISPMDGEPYAVLGESFLDFLAFACGVSDRIMKNIFLKERSGKRVLATFLKNRFKLRTRFLAKVRTRRLSHHLQLIQPKKISAGRHSEGKEITVTCSCCGNTFTSKSSLGHDLQIKSCSNCHGS